MYCFLYIYFHTSSLLFLLCLLASITPVSRRINGKCLASPQLTLSITKRHFNGPSVSEQGHKGVSVSIQYEISFNVSKCSAGPSPSLCDLLISCMQANQISTLHTGLKRTHSSVSPERVNYLT